MNQRVILDAENRGEGKYILLFQLNEDADYLVHYTHDLEWRLKPNTFWALKGVKLLPPRIQLPCEEPK